MSQTFENEVRPILLSLAIKFLMFVCLVEPWGALGVVQKQTCALDSLLGLLCLQSHSTNSSCTFET